MCGNQFDSNHYLRQVKSESAQKIQLPQSRSNKKFLGILKRFQTAKTKSDGDALGHRIIRG